MAASTPASQAKKKDICTECSLDDILGIVEAVEKNENVAVALLTRPRTLLGDLGYALPTRAKVWVIPTEELRARGAGQEAARSMMSDIEARMITAHVASGLAKCVKIEFE